MPAKSKPNALADKRDAQLTIRLPKWLLDAIRDEAAASPPLSAADVVLKVLGERYSKR